MLGRVVIASLLAPGARGEDNVIMKRQILALVFSFLAAVTLVAAEAPRRVLFIGNSYTGVNQLPKVFAEVVRSAQGAAPEIKSSTPGGRTLRQQLGIPASMALIDEGGWDVVVLQGQSQEPARAEKDEAVRKEFLDAAAELCRRVRAKSPAARIYFYETWARHADYWKTPQATELGKDPAEMQARLRKWYGEAAKLCQATVVPVGDAWERNYQSAHPVRLHQKDLSHPEFVGTYLAALVFYKTLYEPKELKVGYRGKLSAEEAEGMLGLVR